MGIFIEIDWCLLLMYIVANLGHSIPPAVIAAIALIIAQSKNFPHHGQSKSKNRQPIAVFSKATLKKADFFGTTLIFVATLLFVAALKKAGRKYP